MSLLYGVHEHGLSDFPRLFVDHKLCFAKNKDGVAAHRKAKGERSSNAKGFYLSIYLYIFIYLYSSPFFLFFFFLIFF